MTDNINKLMAEALVECGYALKQKKLSDGNYYIYLDMSNSGNYIREHPANPFADTLEGRRQADGLEDWLCSRYELIPDSVWEQSMKHASLTTTRHQWRLDRIKWCFEQLAEKS